MGTDSGFTERQSFWLEYLRACMGGSMAMYAEANGLNMRLLYGAKKRLKRRGQCNQVGYFREALSGLYDCLRQDAKALCLNSRKWRGQIR